MTDTIIRPLPVPAEVGIRSALLALANLGAELQTYNEESRTIVAQMPQWFGVKKASVLIRVQDYGENCRMELQLPDKSKASELTRQISLYLVDGHRAASDMTMRWVEKQDQEQSLAQTAGKKVGQAIRRLQSSPRPTDSKMNQAIVVSDSAEAQGQTPEFMIADPNSRQVRLNVNPDIFEDRSGYLDTCTSCAAIVLRGNQFCGNCGRPITLDAVATEVDQVTRNSARSSLIFGGLALAANLISLYFLILAPLGNEAVDGSNTLPFVNILLSLVLGILPGLLLGNEARRMAKTADLYLKFRFNKDQGGRSNANVGRIIGWAAIYLSVGWVAYLIALNFF
jgi:hypothetical protein